jgi:hypothetical protein
MALVAALALVLGALTSPPAGAHSAGRSAVVAKRHAPKRPQRHRHLKRHHRWKHHPATGGGGGFIASTAVVDRFSGCDFLTSAQLQAETGLSGYALVPDPYGDPNGVVECMITLPSTDRAAEERDYLAIVVGRANPMSVAAIDVGPGCVASSSLGDFVAGQTCSYGYAEAVTGAAFDDFSLELFSGSGWRPMDSGRVPALLQAMEAGLSR